MNPIVLYHGTNATQEFWESADANVVLFRLADELKWLAYRKGKTGMKYLGSNQRVETLARECGCLLSEEKKWEEREDKHFYLVFCN